MGASKRRLNVKRIAIDERKLKNRKEYKDDSTDPSPFSRSDLLETAPNA